MSMYAPVGSITTLLDLRDMGVLGEYHLLLAPDVIAFSKTYKTTFYGKGWHIILDNGAAEGEAIKGQELIEAGFACGANVIIVPDVFEDKERTVGAAEDFFKVVSPHIRGSVHWMLVPQGKTLDQATQCIVDLDDIIGAGTPRFWGIPYHFTHKLGTRKGLINYCSNYSGTTIGDNIHLLGMSDNYDDDVACARMPGVMGIDSANPIVLGLAEKYMDGSDYCKEPRGDYMSKTHHIGSDERAIIVKTNIQKLRGDITTIT